jgi:hypothetical protein
VRSYSIVTCDEGFRLSSKENIFFINILRVYVVKLLNFMSARSFLSIFCVRAALEPLCTSSLMLGGVGINDSEDRRIFSDPSLYVLC